MGHNVVKEPGGRLSVLGDETAFDKIVQAIDPPQLDQDDTPSQSFHH